MQKVVAEIDSLMATSPPRMRTTLALATFVAYMHAAAVLGTPTKPHILFILADDYGPVKCGVIIQDRFCVCSSIRATHRPQVQRRGLPPERRDAGEPVRRQHHQRLHLHAAHRRARSARARRTFRLAASRCHGGGLAMILTCVAFCFCCARLKLENYYVQPLCSPTRGTASSRRRS